MKPLSIIIACRNGTNYLAEAIAGLQQQDMDMEIIVVDDGSTDATTQLAADLGCVVKSIPHSGLSAARNEGLRHSVGRMALFHDHDDVMRPGALRRLVAALEADDAFDIVMAQARDFISPELDEADKATLSPRPEPYYGLLSGAVLFRRKVFDRIGMFPEDLPTCLGMDVLQRAEEAGLLVRRLPFVTVGRRLHGSNMGRTMRQQEYTDYATMLRRRLARGK